MSKNKEKRSKEKKIKFVEDTRTLIQILPGKGVIGRVGSRSGSAFGGGASGERGVSGRGTTGMEGLARILHAQDRQRTYKEKSTGTRCIKHRTPISYEMYFEPDSYRFYMSVPTASHRSVSEHIKKAWTGSSVRILEDDYIEVFETPQAAYCDIHMEKYYVFPLKFGAGEPFNSLMNVAKGLKQGEKMMFQTMMIPLKTNWQIKAREVAKNFEETGKATPGTGFEGVLNAAGDEVIEVFDIFTNSLFGLKEEDKKKQKTPPRTGDQDIKAIYDKISESAFKCMMRVFVIAENNNRKIELLSEVASALRSIEGRNLLKMSAIHYQTPYDMTQRYAGVAQNYAFNRNVLTISEIAGLLQAPDTVTLDRNPEIERAGQQVATPPPPHMFNGSCPIGIMDVEVSPKILYWDHWDLDQMMAAKVIAGPPGSGKTTMLQTLIHSLRRINHGVFVFDIIERCGLTKEIADSLNPGEYEVWDVEEEWREMSFDFAEAYEDFNPDDYVTRKTIAKTIADQIVQLLDAINKAELTDRMERVIRAAAKLVFVFENQTLNDFIQVLRFADVRERVIHRAETLPKNSEGTEMFTREEIDDLRILDCVDKEGELTGETDRQIVDPILTRLSFLIEDPRTARMLQNKPNPKYNIKDAVFNNKIILVRIPQTASRKGAQGFGAKTRAMLTAFFSFKIWMVKENAMAGMEPDSLVDDGKGGKVKLRDQYATHIVYDEVHQVPETLSMLRERMKEFRKFRLAPIFTCHGLSNFSEEVVKEIDKLSPAYLLMKGTEYATIEKLAKTTIRGLDMDDMLDLELRYLVAHIPAGNRFLDVIVKSPGPIHMFEELEKEIKSQKRVSKVKRKKMTASQRFFSQLETVGIRIEKAEDAPIDKFINYVSKLFDKSSSNDDQVEEDLSKEMATSMLTEEVEVLTEEELEQLEPCEFEISSCVVDDENVPLVNCKKQSNPVTIKYLQKWMNKPTANKATSEPSKIKDSLVTKEEVAVEVERVQPSIHSKSSYSKDVEENEFVKRAREQALKYRTRQMMEVIKEEETSSEFEPITTDGKMDLTQMLKLATQNESDE